MSHYSDSDDRKVEIEEEVPQRPIEEIEKELEQKCWDSFMKYEIGGEGKILSTSVAKVFADMGMDGGEDEVFRFLSDIDPENSGYIQYSDFKPRIMERELAKVTTGDDDDELMDAYVAMGGDDDGGGCIDADKLIDTIKNEFGMTIDIERLIEEIDEDGSGEIEFDEFRALLTGDA